MQREIRKYPARWQISAFGSPPWGRPIVVVARQEGRGKGFHPRSDDGRPSSRSASSRARRRNDTTTMKGVAGPSGNVRQHHDDEYEYFVIDPPRQG